LLHAEKKIKISKRDIPRFQFQAGLNLRESISLQVLLKALLLKETTPEELSVLNEFQKEVAEAICNLAKAIQLPEKNLREV